jgi:hypothetical protein
MPFTIPIHLSNSKHSGLKAMDDHLQEILKSRPGKTLREVADHLLAKARELADKRLLTWDRLEITLHKIKSEEWNVLMIRYRKMPWKYHAEVVLIPDQTSLKL